MCNNDFEVVTATHEAAMAAASNATVEYLYKHGDRDCCGFAWVTIYDVKLSTKLGKHLVKLGFSKAYGGGIQLWNPSKNYTQALTAKEKGAEAYAEVMRKAFPNMKIYAGSRMD